MRDLLRWLAAALALALGAALLWAVEQHRALNRERAEALADRQAYVELEGKLTHADRARLAAETTLNSQVESDIRRMFPESRAVPESAAVDQFNAELDGDPIWQPFYRKLEQRRILARYAPLFSALNLPGEKLAPLEDLLVERAVTNRTLVHRLRATGRKFSAAETIAAVDHATDEIDAKIRKLIGRDAAQKLREWNGAIYSYGSIPNGPVAQDAVTLNGAGFAVSPDQLVRLALIRYEVSVLNPDARPGSGSDRLDPKTGLTRLENQLLTREAEVLTPAEIAVLRAWALETHRARAAVDALRTKYRIDATTAPR